MNIETLNGSRRRSISFKGEKPYNILVIDDDDTSSFILFEAFSKVLGHNVYHCSNGTDGINIFKNNLIDIIITDLYMPGINGYETARIIRKTNAAIPIIAITGSPDADINDKIKECGINAFILKPYNIFSLALLINSLIEKSAEI